LFLKHLRETGRASRRDLARILYHVARHKLGLLDVDRVVAASLGWIRGRDESAVRADCEAWYAGVIRPYVFPAMITTVGAHRRAGHVVAILTSATRYLAEPLAADLGIEHVLVTRLVVQDGVFTGEAVPPVCYGTGKTFWAERFARTEGIDFDRSYFYADSIADLPLLERVGEPRVVNPDPRLRRAAQRHGWKVLQLSLGDRVPSPEGASASPVRG
jgi:HAD superfamily hydrolase (TIGR01490 family)